MATFLCVAIDSKGNAVNTKVEGASRADVINALAKQGLRPVSIKEFKNNSVKIDIGKIGKRKKVKSHELGRADRPRVRLERAVEEGGEGRVRGEVRLQNIYNFT